MTNPYVPKGSFQFDPNRPLSVMRKQEIPDSVFQRIAAFCDSCPREYVQTFAEKAARKNCAPLFNSPSQPVQVCVVGRGGGFDEKDFLDGYSYIPYNGMPFEMNCTVTLSEDEMTVMLYFSAGYALMGEPDQVNIYMLYFFSSLHGVIDMQQPPHDVKLRSFVESIAFESLILGEANMLRTLPEPQQQNLLLAKWPNLIYVQNPPLYHFEED